MPWFYYDLNYILFMLPVFILTIWAQIKVKTTYTKYSKIQNSGGMTGYEMARYILDANGLHHVAVERTAGQLSDHFDPRANTVRLSEGVHDGNSVAAIGIAAHECGHAIQYAMGYGPIKLRNAIIPITNFASQLTTPLIIMSIVFSLPILFRIGIIFFAVSTLFQLITLPVEFNASRRAVEQLDGSMRVSGEDLAGTKKVLSAAAMTYVGALATSLMSLLYLVFVSRNSRR